MRISIFLSSYLSTAIDAFKDDFHVPVHIVQVDNSSKVIVQRDMESLNVYWSEEVALPVELGA
jgi:hypothetical protein